MSHKIMAKLFITEEKYEKAANDVNHLPLFSRNEATRTPDPYVPNVVRYQLRYIPIATLSFVCDAKVDIFSIPTKKRISFFHKKLFFTIFIPFILEIKDFGLSLQTQNDGAIAQLVEQRTENPCVPGSIPGGTTINS